MAQRKGNEKALMANPNLKKFKFPGVHAEDTAGAQTFGIGQ